ncbi:sodium:proton antiporter [Pseudohoeflea suaedae]|uniref:Sodium:proton antiporter n=1 Tax=Pseudohoeflea suaedae TaxID=877384 RepID=A0A4R5PI86_9HYPH|nr:sodium:proton antiporter [Pseudohoeflea suaedae]TDH34235.1 sodium:proton antiporter [Pseudohoeflea suaedae]
MDDIALKIAFIGAAGMTAQWLAWRLHLPAIVLLLAAGFLAGPVTGFLDPAEDFGDIYRPIISIAVAVILFEGGLTLNLREIRETSRAVQRIIMIAGPLTWLGTALSAHYIGGLSWPTAVVLGAILIVTGPTVIMPLLRQSQLGARPASLLRWEAIVNDPIGALCAVIAFETVLVVIGDHDAGRVALELVLGGGGSIVLGFIGARLIEWTFIRGHVPEYLKAPVLFAVVIGVYALADLALEEAGLLAVTIMGIFIANTRIASLTDMRRFKETITTLLVSGLFILLTASLTYDDILGLNLQALLFVLSLLFVIRPIAVMVATIGSGATIQERILTSWIAPRGVVAVAVSGLFGALLIDTGIEDANRMIAFSFAVVVTTIVLHGFTLGPLAKLLNLTKMSRPGLLIVGGSRWSTALAAKLQEHEVPVTLADPNWNHLSHARLSDIPVYFGEVLSENAHHTIEPKRYANLIATTDNDAYNALVCTDFGPELGRSHVFQIGRDEEANHRALSFTLGGRPLTKPGMSFHMFRERFRDGWTFHVTGLTEEYTWDAYTADRPEDNVVLLWIKPSGSMVFSSIASNNPAPGDKVLSFGIPNGGPPKAANEIEQRKLQEKEAQAEAEGEPESEPDVITTDTKLDD